MKKNCLKKKWNRLEIRGLKTEDPDFFFFVKVVREWFLSFSQCCCFNQIFIPVF